MVGDGIRDMPAMHEANVSIAFRSSSQAAFQTADILLLDDSLHVLPTVLHRGQRTVNSLLDTLKLNLTQVTYLLLLVVVAAIAGRVSFFYHPAHGGVIVFFTVVVPGVALALFSADTAVPPALLVPRLVHFILPAAGTMTVAILVLDYVLSQTGAGVIDAQHAVTLTIVAMGLMLFVYVQPPVRALVGGDAYSGNWLFTALAAVLFVLYLILTRIPLTQLLMRVGLPSDPRTYVIIGLVYLLWAVVLRAIWRILPLRRYAGIVVDDGRPTANDPLMPSVS
jgi:magnesium-transporting ATPase (P-type)